MVSIRQAVLVHLVAAAEQVSTRATCSDVVGEVRVAGLLGLGREHDGGRPGCRPVDVEPHDLAGRGVVRRPGRSCLVEHAASSTMRSLLLRDARGSTRGL